jgi:DNA polymerase sigma
MKVRLLRDLAGMMRSARITQDVAVIHRAKVPIIKFVTTEGE